MLNIERGKVNFYNMRRDTVFCLTCLYAECEDTGGVFSMMFYSNFNLRLSGM